MLPLTEHGFSLHKGAFRDALSLCYGWQLIPLPGNCVYGKHFTIEHAFSCSQGGFPSLRHNDVRDITANLLSEVSHQVAVEPDIQALSGKQFQHRTANTEDGARLDVRAQGFWGDKHQGAFFDIRVFNPYAPSNCKSTMESVYRIHERKKRHCYERRILDHEVEHGSFTPLVFSPVGGMGTAACNSDVQEIGILPGRQACSVILEDHELDSMPAELLPVEIVHHVRSWGTFHTRQSLLNNCPWRRPA